MARRATLSWALPSVLLALVALALALPLIPRPTRTASAVSPVTRAAHTPHNAPALRRVTIGMGYEPSVQFAPFYVAAQRSYYRQAGLDVTFSYAPAPNLTELVGAGNVDFANTDGTEVIAAAARGIPITYIMSEYQRLPVAIFALARSGIRSVANLRGRTIGVPGLYGSVYVGLLAALRVAGLTPNDVRIEAIGYTQVDSVALGRVDAAVGYSVNEPVLLARRGYQVVTLEVSSVTNLVAPGVITGESFAAHYPTVARAFVQATLRGLADTIRDPRMAFAAARQVGGLTTLRGRAADDQYAVLLRAIDFWHGPNTRAHGLGYVDPAQWHSSQQALRAIGQPVPAALPPSLFTNTFAAGAAHI